MRARRNGLAVGASITLDPATETANLIGQNGGAGIQVPWSTLRLP